MNALVNIIYKLKSSLMKKSIFTPAFLLMVSFILSGYATLFGPKSYPLAISSERGGAEVY